MRRRAGHGVRILNRCARCTAPRGRVAMQLHAFTLTVNGVRVPHELMVCSSCARERATEPTYLEREALRVDVSDPIARMRFVELHGHDPVLFQRTARYFLGDDVVDRRLTTEAQVPDIDDEVYADWRERHRRDLWSDMYEEAEERTADR